MNPGQFRKWLRSKGACEEALSWLDTLPYGTPAYVWRHCTRGDWLIWWYLRARTKQQRQEFDPELEEVFARARTKTRQHRLLRVAMIGADDCRELMKMPEMEGLEQ